MVVEDDLLLNSVLTDTLTEEGFEVVSVADGSEVVNAAMKEQPAMILLDLVLPGVDGFEVLKQLKSDTKTALIPVVVISNLDGVADVKSVGAMGADQYFIKAETELDKIIKYVKKKIK